MGSNQKKKGKKSSDNSKWAEISRKSNEGHRKALEKTEADAELKRREVDSDMTENTGEEDWQQLSKNERETLDTRRGGYPKNVYEKNEDDDSPDNTPKK